jgi:hypothetical protein
MSINATGSLTAGFIDLATFDELEKYLYGGADATAYFVMAHKTSTWFTLCPTILSKNMGQAGFGQDWAASISRAGDYLVHTWLRADIPSITGASGKTIRWTHNFAHNLIKEAAVTFNDLIAARFDSYYLDFWAAFTVPASKQCGYNNMIGNTPAQFDASYNNASFQPANTIPAFTINLPLPFFFTRDSGLALPTAALPYNEMRIQFNFRDWTELLVAYDSPNVVGGATTPGRRATSSDVVTVPVLQNCNCWAEYAIVSNDERKRMGCAPRDILIEQVQTAPRTNFKLGESNSTDIRFSHAVKLLLFAGRNTTVSSDWSVYTVGNVATNGWVGREGCVDTVTNATLLYENTQRLAGLPADYYSLVEPWFKAPTIPRETGYHMYSYSLNMYDVNPLGSTNYGKLTNVTLVMQGASGLQTSPNLNTQQPGTQPKIASQGTSFEGLIVAVNHNVIRVSGGALGFPVL